MANDLFFHAVGDLLEAGHGITGLAISMHRDASAMVRMQKDMHNQGYAVSGSDLVESRATRHLRQLGAKVFLGHAAAQVEDADVLVVGAGGLGQAGSLGGAGFDVAQSGSSGAGSAGGGSILGAAGSSEGDGSWATS